MPLKLTKRKALYFYKDEKHAAKTYRKLGLHEMAEDEARHARYFKKRVKTMKCKRRKNGGKLLKRLHLGGKSYLTGIEKGTIRLLGKRKR